MNRTPESAPGPRARSRALLAGFLSSQKGWLIAAAACLVLAAAVHPWDRPISNALHDHPALTGERGEEFHRLFQVFGKGEVLVALALGLGLLGLRRRALEILAALLLMGALVTPVKAIVHRERPDRGDSLSFPSGDAAAAACAAVPLVARVPLAIPGAGAVVGMVGFTRVIYGRHYPSDVLASFGFGLLAGAVARELGRRVRLRVRRRHFAPAAALAIAAMFTFAAFAGHRGVELVRLARWYVPALALALAARHIRLGLRWGAGRALLRRLAAGWKPALAVAAAVLGLYLLVAARSTLWDRDEPRFARAAVEMVQSGDYLVPTFNGGLRPDKPALIYWLMSVPVRLFGPGELACRLPAVLGTVAACLLTWWLGRRLFGGPSGLLAMGALAATPLLLVSGAAATTDAVLLAFILGALALFAPALAGALGWGRAAFIGLALGGALLTKGPVGLALPLLAVGATLLAARRELASAGRRYVAPLVAAAALGAGLFLLWAVPANAATGGEFLRRGLGHHVFARMGKALEGHGGDYLAYLAYLPYYLLVVAGGFFPWVLFLPGALSALVGGRLVEPRARALLLAWMATTFAVMTLVATKLPHYLLPIWPALALVVAGVLVRRAEGALAERDERWLRRGMWVFLPVGITLGLGLLVAPWFLPVAKVRGVFCALGLLILVLVALVRREQRAGRWGGAAAVMLAGMVILQAYAGLAALPAVERFKLAPRLAAAIRARAGPEVPLATCQFAEPSLVFYARRPMETLDPDQVAGWAGRPGPGVLVIPREVLASVEDEFGPLELAELGSASGINYSNGDLLDLVVLGRPGVAGGEPVPEPTPVIRANQRRRE